MIARFIVKTYRVGEGVVLLAETDSLSGLSHSVVEYVTPRRILVFLINYKVVPGSLNRSGSDASV
jgi:hypothetical protein